MTRDELYQELLAERYRGHQQMVRAEGLEDRLSLLTRAAETVCAYTPDDDSDDDFKAAFEQLRQTLRRMPV